jgi:hypothetical protein
MELPRKENQQQLLFPELWRSKKGGAPGAPFPKIGFETIGLFALKASLANPGRPRRYV